MSHPWAVTACVGSGRGWSQRRSGRSGAFSPQNGIKISILCLIYSCWLFVCARANCWPPVKTVPTHLRGPKWALSGWHRAGHMSLLLWRRILPVFCCHLLPASGHAARRGRVSRLVLEIRGRRAVFASHLTDTPRCLHIARYWPFSEDSERHLSSSQLLGQHVIETHINFCHTLFYGVSRWRETKWSLHVNRLFSTRFSIKIRRCARTATCSDCSVWPSDIRLIFTSRLYFAYMLSCWHLLF